MNASTLIPTRRILVASALAALVPFAAAHAGQDCRNDPFYSIKLYSGEAGEYTCVASASATREAAVMQRGAEGPIRTRSDFAPDPSTSSDAMSLHWISSTGVGTPRGAEGPVKSAKTEQERMQDCRSDPFYSIKQYSGEANEYTCVSSGSGEGKTALK